MMEMIIFTVFDKNKPLWVKIEQLFEGLNGWTTSIFLRPKKDKKTRRRWHQTMTSSNCLLGTIFLNLLFKELQTQKVTLVALAWWPCNLCRHRDLGLKPGSVGFFWQKDLVNHKPKKYMKLDLNAITQPLRAAFPIESSLRERWQ